MPEEARAILATAAGKWRPMIMTAIFSGVRASELRGLRWQDLDLEKGTLTVSQRADKYGEIGAPKSAAAHRTIPGLPPVMIDAHKAWHQVCPSGENDLVFPTARGRIESLPNL